jgi:hypothetical protein
MQKLSCRAINEDSVLSHRENVHDAPRVEVNSACEPRVPGKGKLSPAIKPKPRLLCIGTEIQFASLDGAPLKNAKYSIVRLDVASDQPSGVGSSLAFQCRRKVLALKLEVSSSRGLRRIKEHNGTVRSGDRNRAKSRWKSRRFSPTKFPVCALCS